MSCNDLLSRLEGVRRTGEGRWIARCPAHADRRASLSIRELEDGRVLMHDFAGCSVEEVLAATGLTFEALFPPRQLEHGASERRPFPAGDVLQALAGELMVISIIVSDFRRGEPLKPADYARLDLAIERVQAGREIALGR